MTETPLADAHRLLAQAMSAVAAVAESGADHELVSLLTLCEGATRQLDRITVDAIAVLDRRGVFIERGYRSTPGALGDLLGWEGREAHRRVVAAEHVTARTGPVTGDSRGVRRREGELCGTWRSCRSGWRWPGTA